MSGVGAILLRCWLHQHASNFLWENCIFWDKFTIYSKNVEACWCHQQRNNMGVHKEIRLRLSRFHHIWCWLHQNASNFLWENCIFWDKVQFTPRMFRHVDAVDNVSSWRCWINWTTNSMVHVINDYENKFEVMFIPSHLLLTASTCLKLFVIKLIFWK